MNSLYMAGRALGKAVPSVWNGRDASALVLEAAAAVARSGDASLAPVVPEMRSFPPLASRTQDAALVAIVQHLRDDRLHSRPNAGYHAFCIGHLLGELEAGLLDEGAAKPVTSEKRERYAPLLPQALQHVVSLRDGYGVRALSQFEVDLKAIGNGLATAKRGADLKAVGYLVQTCSSKIGNAIP